MWKSYKLPSLISIYLDKVFMYTCLSEIIYINKSQIFGPKSFKDTLLPTFFDVKKSPRL